MRKKEIGQAFILVLILLGIGALLVVPSLRLTGTSLMSSQVVERRTKGLYAADAAQEYILWKLLYDKAWLNATLQDENDFDEFKFYVCDVPVGVKVVMRAVVGEGGVCLSGDDVIRPTKTVTPPSGGDDDPILPIRTPQDYTYIITLDHVSDDASVCLDAIYDVLPSGFRSDDYKEGSSKLSVDGGASWNQVPDPDFSVDRLLRWPDEYDLDTGTGDFASNPLFLDIEDFMPGDEKMLKFEVTGEFNKEGVYYNWVVLKMDDGEDGFNTVSGATAPITIGDPDDSTTQKGQMKVEKAAIPKFIQPGTEELVDYTITITNMDVSTRQIEAIIDYLPPEFFYVDGTISGFITDTVGIPSDITINEPQKSVGEMCTLEREVLWWGTLQLGGDTLPLQSGYILTLTFQAETTKNVSGTYYNEVFVINELEQAALDLPGIFAEIGVSPAEYGSVYSWNTGEVMVPAYDTSSEAEGITINANMSLILQGITITSWHVD